MEAHGSSTILSGYDTTCSWDNHDEMSPFSTWWDKSKQFDMPLADDADTIAETI